MTYLAMKGVGFSRESGRGGVRWMRGAWRELNRKNWVR